jgi:hypothetical protein
MAETESTARRRDLALVEIEALAVNTLHDVRALERKLIALSPGAAVMTHADCQMLTTNAECIRCEVQEARR